MYLKAKPVHVFQLWVVVHDQFQIQLNPTNTIHSLLPLYASITYITFTRARLYIKNNRYKWQLVKCLCCSFSVQHILYL